MISVRGVSMQYPVPKRYREYLLHPLTPPRRRVALREVDLEVAAGESLALLGPNGAGKTTLLKLIGGLLYPTDGHVSIDGLDVAERNLDARGRVGFVINEERSFYWRLTGQQNLDFFGVLENLTGAELRERSARLLGLVGLADAAERRVSDYSSGMKQRLAIARGLLADPDVLLLDEPTKSLDLVGAAEIRRLIAGELREEGRRTLVVATNHVGDVTQLCDRLCVIDRGGIVGARPLAGASEQAIAEFYHASVGRAA